MNKVVELFKELVDEYDYEYDIKKLPFMIQPFPILSDCVGFDGDKFERIDTEEKFIFYSNKIFEKAEEIMNKNTSMDDRLRTLLFLLIHKPFHIPFLIKLKTHIDRDTFSELLSDIWIHTEFPHQNGKDIMLELFLYANIQKLMTKEEKKEFDTLPNKIKVYRGLQKDAIPNGLSWTTDKKIAKFFANRFERKGKIIKAEISKKDCFAFKNIRNESEIILNPDKLKLVVIK